MIASSSLLYVFNTLKYVSCNLRCVMLVQAVLYTLIKCLKQLQSDRNPKTYHFMIQFVVKLGYFSQLWFSVQYFTHTLKDNIFIYIA
jgi:1,4-dihydroxy-2-naphthoate octaprenyltransferase